MNDKPHLEEETASTNSAGLPAVREDPSLTLPPDRLAGSACCLNCGTPLKGPFCYYCGQPDKNFLRFFPVLLRELMEDFLDFDSRFMRTIKPLLFRPGKLTRDYLAGRRFRYTPPLRLYIFSSIACFFLAALVAQDIVQINDDDAGDGVVAPIQIGKIDDPEVQRALEKLDEETRQEVAEAMEKAQQEDGAGINTDGIEINGKPWDRETNPFVIDWMPDWVNDWVNDEIERSPQKGEEIEANPDLFKDKLFDVLPATMFVLLPLFALLMKFWYLFAKRYYVEHLIYALHNHSFLFVTAVIGMLLGVAADWLDPDGAGWIADAVRWTTIAIWIWIPLYLLISMKRVYGQGWAMTTTKFCVVGLSYAILLALATAFVVLLSFVLL